MSNILLDLMGVLGAGAGAGTSIFVDGGPTVGSPDAYADSTPGGSQIQVNFNFEQRHCDSEPARREQRSI